MKRFNLTITDDGGYVTEDSENEGFSAFELLGFLEMKQQDILEQIRRPDNFVRRLVDGTIVE